MLYLVSVRYRGGLRGRMKMEIIQLLKEYHRVEEAFQGMLRCVCTHVKYVANNMQ